MAVVLDTGFLIAILLVVTILLHRSGRPGSVFADALRATPPQREQVDELVQLEHTVRFATASAGDVHFRLCPLLREIAQSRLQQHGMHIDNDPEAAEAALGKGLWELVRRERPMPENRLAKGIPLAAINHAIAKLEEL
jgi:hypothetical protein